MLVALGTTVRAMESAPVADSTTVEDSAPDADTTTVDESPAESEEEFTPDPDTTTVDGDIDSGSNESSNNNGGSRSGSRRSSGGGSSVPSGAAVLGASTGPNGETLSCAPYLTTYMRIGQTNDVEEVKKLQTFLNEFNGEKLPVTGFFGELTYWAVRRLQAKYTNEILQPWVDAGLVEQLNPTGYAYKMTQWFINTHKCPDANIPQPELK